MKRAMHEKVKGTIYPEIRVRPQKHVRCSDCGAWVTRSKLFFQTLNPHNKKKNGEIKTREDIEAELSVIASDWMRNSDRNYCTHCKERGNEKKSPVFRSAIRC